MRYKTKVIKREKKIKNSLLYYNNIIKVIYNYVNLC